MWTFRGFNHFFQTVTVETKFNSSVHLKNSESRPSAGCWGINEQLPVCVTMFYYTPFRVYYCVSVCGWVTLFYYMCVLKSVLLCVCVHAPVFGGTKGSLKVFLGLKYLVFLKQIWVVFQEGGGGGGRNTNTAHTVFTGNIWFNFSGKSSVQLYLIRI